MIEVELPDGTIVEFPAGTTQDVMRQALSKLPQAAAPQTARQRFEEQGFTDVAGRLNDGVIMRNPTSGEQVYTSPGYNTSDPAEVKRLAKGAKPAETFWDGVAIDQNPVAARGLKALEGVPFVGSYADEAIGAMFGDQARDAARLSSKAMDREKPWQSAGLQLAGGVAATVPALMAAAPSMAANSLGGNMARGAGLGAAEGAVRGFGRGEGGAGNRLGTAGIDAGIGAAIGGAIPAIAHGVGAAYGGARNWLAERAGIGRVADDLGISRGAGRLASDVIGMDDPQQMRAALAAAGPDGMLADAGPSVQGALDAVIQSPGEGARMALGRIDDRATAAGQRLTDQLDQALGAPAGIESAKSAVRTGTKAARKSAYDAAYAQPIDYGSGAVGERLLGLQDRLPGKAISYANELMRLNGEQSGQIMASIADDGAVAFQRLPDVRQWDYIKQALDQLAESGDGAGALGGQTRLGSAYQGLARQVRDNLADAVPEYRAALDTAVDAIGRVKAVDIGVDLLNSKTTRERAADAISGMTGPELAAVKQGVRQQIDDMVANVRAVATDPNIDAREAYTAWTRISSTSAKDKMEMLLGPDWPALRDQLDTAGRAIGLRSRVASNSRTFSRQQFNELLDAAHEVGAIRKGEPINSAREVWQRAMGATQSQIQNAKAGDRAGLADLLTRRGGDGLLSMFEDARTAHPIIPDRGRGLIDMILGGGAASAPTLGNELHKRLLPR